MAIDAKISFCEQVAAALADRVTVEQMDAIRRAVMNVTDRFEMREIQEGDAETDDLLDCYLSAMRVECRSEKTVARYEYVIRRMMDAVAVPTRRITVHHLRGYLAREKERGVADSTLEGTRQVFSAYFNWLQREALIERNPTANLGTVKVAKKVKPRYTEIEMEKLNRNCATVRDRAILHFLASTGCRISEMCGLDRDAVDLEKLECVVHGKGNKERTVYLSAVAGEVLADFHLCAGARAGSVDHEVAERAAAAGRGTVHAERAGRKGRRGACASAQVPADTGHGAYQARDADPGGRQRAGA